MDLPSGGSQRSVLSGVFNSISTHQFTAHFSFSFLYFTFQCVLPVFIVDWTFSHLERLIGSISVLENGPRESHTRIPILTLYLVSLLVSVQQAEKSSPMVCQGSVLSVFGSIRAFQYSAHSLVLAFFSFTFQCVLYQSSSHTGLFHTLRR